MARRLALLIGNQTFRADSSLPPLHGPANDVKALAKVLKSPELGDFEVTTFIDKRREKILPFIDATLSGAARPDMVLIYHAGHGFLDSAGRLCLATAETRDNARYATSIPSPNLRDIVSTSRCDSVILFLDCCYSGGIGNVESQISAMHQSGVFILSASTGAQSAEEAETGDSGRIMGVFTAALVRGISSGEADYNGDGLISFTDLQRYLQHNIKGQTAQAWMYGASDDPVIAKVRTVAPITLAPDMRVKHARPRGFDHIALVLEGNMERGAYHAGVYQAMHEAGLEPDWIIGSAAGAVNTALLAGNAPQRRLPQLVAFWKEAALRLPSSPARPLENRTAEVFAGWLRGALLRQVDFDRLNSTLTRAGFSSANVETGNFVYFDTAFTMIQPEHVMASSAMATAETIVSLDDQHYWGGDLLPVTPLQFLINSSSSKRLLVFHVGSIGLERGLPRTADEAADRERDIHMSGRTRAAIDNFRTLFNLRSSFSQLLNRVPDISLNCQHLELKRTLQQLPAMKLILLHCRVHSDETDIQVAPELRYREWWHAGYQDAVRLLREESGTLLPPPSGSGLVITSLEPTLDDF